MFDRPRAVLARYPAIVQPLSPLEPLGNAGGLSGAKLWRFASGRGPHVLRLWPIDGPRRVELERIHRWLAHAAALGIIPVPVAGRDGATVQEYGGRLWELAPWLPGAAEADRPPPPARLRSAMVALAAFHQALGQAPAVGPSPGLVARLRETELLTLEGFTAVERVLARAHGDEALEPALRWLELARSTAAALLEPHRLACARRVPLQPCLRDARPEHWLFEADRVSGLVDFGAMGVETVAADLARLLSDWVGQDPAGRNEALQVYEAIRPLDPAEVTMIGVFEASAALLGPAHWIRWRFVEGRVFEDPSAVVAGIERGVARLALVAASRSP